MPDASVPCCPVCGQEVPVGGVAGNERESLLFIIAGLARPNPAAQEAYDRLTEVWGQLRPVAPS